VISKDDAADCYAYQAYYDSNIHDIECLVGILGVPRSFVLGDAADLANRQSNVTSAFVNPRMYFSQSVYEDIKSWLKDSARSERIKILSEKLRRERN